MKTFFFFFFFKVWQQLSPPKVDVSTLCWLLRPALALPIYPGPGGLKTPWTADTLGLLNQKVEFHFRVYLPHFSSFPSLLLMWMRSLPITVFVKAAGKHLHTHSVDSHSTYLCTHNSVNPHKHTYVCANPHKQSSLAAQTQNLSVQNLHTKLHAWTGF